MHTIMKNEINENGFKKFFTVILKLSAEQGPPFVSILFMAGYCSIQHRFHLLFIDCQFK